MRLRSLPVTVVIPVKNEERNLPRCLAALGRFEKILVVDSGSTDQTTAIAEAAGAEVLQFLWDGLFPKKRNWVLMNYTFHTDWVLFLDADEVVDDVFCDAIGHAINSASCIGYWLRYTNYFLGRELRYGTPQRKLAFFKVGAGLYERVEENRWSALDMEVHEHPVLDGPVGSITPPIQHNDFRGLTRFLERHLDYAVWEARRYLSLSRPTTSASTRRQQLKYRYLLRWWWPSAYFCYTYFARLGFLDGAAGFYYAMYKYWYFTTIRQLIFEYQEQESEDRSLRQTVGAGRPAI